MTDSIERIKDLATHLRYMRLPVMADLLIQLYGDSTSAQRSTVDILEEIILEGYKNRRQNIINRHLKQVKLSNLSAHISELDFSPQRQLNRDVIEQLKTCQFIMNHRNIIVQGATGTGKSYIANAFCRYVIEQGYTARYTRMIELLSDMTLADMDDRLAAFLKKINKVDVLVIDDFLLTSTNEIEQKYLMEIFELRSKDKSLLLSSQMETGEWHKKLGGGAIADAILDRAVSNSYHIYLSGDSMRQETGSVTSD